MSIARRLGILEQRVRLQRPVLVAWQDFDNAEVYRILVDPLAGVYNTGEINALALTGWTVLLVTYEDAVRDPILF